MSNLQNNEAVAAAAAQILNRRAPARLLIVFALVDRVFFSNYVQSGMIIRCCLPITITIKMKHFRCDPQILRTMYAYCVCVRCLLFGKRSGMCVARLLYVSFIGFITLFVSLLSFFLLCVFHQANTIH